MKQRKRFYSIISLVVILTIVLPMFFNIGIKETYGQESSGMLKIAINPPPKLSVFANEELSTQVTYSFSSTGTDGLDLCIDYNIPANMEYLGISEPADTKNIEKVKNEDGSTTIKVHFLSPMKSGLSGFFVVRSKFKNGVLSNNEQGMQVATFTGENQEKIAFESATSNLTYTLKLQEPNWSINKEKYSPNSTPVLGSDVSYKINIKGNDEDSVAIDEMKIIDYLPNGAEYVSSNENGVYDKKNNTIVWNLKNLKVKSNLNLYANIKYPNENFKIDDKVTNKVIATATMREYGVQVKEAYVTHGFSTATKGAGGLNIYSRVANDEYAIGQNIKYYINGFSNTGNVDLNKFIVESDISSSIDLKFINIGSYNKDITLNIKYKTNKNSNFVLWETMQNPNNQKLFISDLINSGRLSKDEYITKIQFDFGNKIPSDFKLKEYNNIEINGVIQAKDRDGNYVKEGQTIKNNACLYWDDSGKIETCTEIKLVAAMGWFQPKIVVNTKSVNYKDIIHYTLTMQNHNRTTGYINAPMGIFIVPEELDMGDLENLKWKIGNNTTESDLYINKPLYKVDSLVLDGKKTTILRWEFNENVVLKEDQYINIEFDAKVKDKTLSGVFKNDFYMSSKDTRNVKNIDGIENDTNNLIGLNDKKHKIKKANCDIFVEFQGSIKAEEWCKGSLDESWTRFAKTSSTSAITTNYKNKSQTVSGGITNYLLKLSTEDVNGTISNLVVIDKLPDINDTGVIGSETRNSKWRPYLINDIKIAALNSSNKLEEIKNSEIKVYYSTKRNMDKNQLDNPLASNNENYWSEKLPEDVTAVRAIKIDFNNYQIKPHSSIFIQWPMKAPVGAPINKVAWNSFAYNATVPTYENGKLSQMRLQPSEPLKAGFEVCDMIKDTFSIGNNVWNDLNADGIHQQNEPGINSVEVNISGKNAIENNNSSNSNDSFFNDFVYLTRTGENQEGNLGYYLFPNLKLGEYDIKFKVPAKYYLSPKRVGEDKTINSCGSTVVDTENLREISADKVFLDKDNDEMNLGIYIPAKVESFVWNDLNENGIKDENEPGIKGADVWITDMNNKEIKDVDGNPINKIKSDDNGAYSFNGLVPGKYKVHFNGNDLNYTFTSKMPGDNGNDADLNGVVDVILISGEVNKTLHAGLHKAVIGNKVWDDLDGDGIKDKNEKGVKDVQISLLNESKDVIRTLKTNKNGEYEFNDLNSGNYYIKVDMPEGYKFYSPITSKSLNKEYNNANNDGITNLIHVNVGEVNSTVDIGIIKPITVGDYVWNDINFDGLQNKGEKGIERITVELLKDNKLAKTVVTDKDGHYIFEDLRPGNYLLKFKDTNNMYISTKTVSNNDINSDINELGETSTYTMLSGMNNHEVDGGFHKGKIESIVWYDKNYDGKKDSDETGIEGVTIRLISLDNKVILETKTDALGKYKFLDLLPNKYYIQVVKPKNYSEFSKKLKDISKVTSVADEKGKTDKFNLEKGQIILNLNVGLTVESQILNYVWDDLNGNGLREAKEPGISGVSVELLNDKKVKIKDTLTNKNGMFAFNQIHKGEYYIKVIMPKEYKYFTKENAFKDEQVDSDFNSEGLSQKIILARQSKNDNIDAGMIKPITIGDYVWEDSNANGLKDSYEKSLKDIKIKLYENKVFLKETVTNGEGKYEFNNLKPGKYSLEFISPNDNYIPTVKGESLVDNKGKTIQYDLISGVMKNDIDCGLHKGKLFGIVWDDLNYDGTFDASEPGIDEIEIQLLNDKDDVVDKTKTNLNGKYYFENLNVGTYHIKVIKPSDYDGFTIQNESRAFNGYGISKTINLKQGEFIGDINAGLTVESIIGDSVWEDVNNNGVKDDGEMGIEGVKIHLLDANRNEVNSVITNINGKYRFTRLKPGIYYIKADLKDGYFTYSKKGLRGSNLESNIINDNGISNEINLSRQNINLDLDISMIKPSKISSFIWNDENLDGIKDSNEEFVSNVKIQLYKDDELITSTKTDEKGMYVFDKLFPGKYFVRIERPNQSIFTSENVEISKQEQKDIKNIYLQSGSEISDIEKGICYYANIITNIVDGKSNIGIPNLKLKLIDLEGNRVKNIFGDVISDQVTDENGRFSFMYLTKGKYKILIEKPKSNVLFKSINLEDIKVKEDGESDIINIEKLNKNYYVSTSIYKKIDEISKKPKHIEHKTETDKSINIPDTSIQVKDYLLVGGLLIVLGFIFMIDLNRKKKDK